MAFRKHRPGELVIEQTRDTARLAAMLERAGMVTHGIDWPPACYIAAFIGDELVGVVGVEPRLDAALIRSLFVAEPMRRRGIGAQLMAAARNAAHTRGARHLYLFGTDAGDFFRRFGYDEVPVAALVDALAGAPQVEYYRARPDELAHEVAFHLDISEDGVIRR
jgi:N-acetylglutamate synthase-like GNAT family acetyltransferase